MNKAEELLKKITAAEKVLATENSLLEQHLDYVRVCVEFTLLNVQTSIKYGIESKMWKTGVYRVANRLRQLLKAQESFDKTVYLDFFDKVESEYFKFLSLLKTCTSFHRALANMGDIYRYKALITKNSTLNLEKALSKYIEASIVAPQYGYYHHCKGLVYLQFSLDLHALVSFLKAAHSKKPFKDSLDIFEKITTKPDQKLYEKALIAFARKEIGVNECFSVVESHKMDENDWFLLLSLLVLLFKQSDQKYIDPLELGLEVTSMCIKNSIRSIFVPSFLFYLVEFDRLELLAQVFKASNSMFDQVSVEKPVISSQVSLFLKESSIEFNLENLLNLQEFKEPKATFNEAVAFCLSKLVHFSQIATSSCTFERNNMKDVFNLQNQKNCLVEISKIDLNEQIDTNSILVLDTNCFIGKLPAVDELYKRSNYQFMIPLIVINELQAINNERSSNALEWIQEQLEETSRIWIENLKGFKILDIELCEQEVALKSKLNDDLILVACLSDRKLVLVTLDKSLRLKAFGKGIVAKEISEIPKL